MKPNLKDTSVWTICILLGLWVNYVYGQHRCLESGQDCIDFMSKSGQYCIWAGDIGAIGAYEKAQGWGRDQLATRLIPLASRPYTVRELTHIDYWMKKGWDKGGAPYSVREFIRQTCEKENP